VSEATLFAFGAVIFIFVNTAVFMYGLLWFRGRELLDDEAARSLACRRIDDPVVELVRRTRRGA
jgi:hypothetical protein